ncbi:hypothetical protein K437DRAFT_81984 [Tilletiaria anomala UBC 951]|uniref:SAP domain-containing protein n=1 Tax=Tilletiaria anomala (strain ATCC 24038 / CBS 436.72 / UBC 951) TaxID=1037660 RepID=A0A066W4N2_TILAU|nr:uncharacterized protein K437DRAFT_81984 [Tilletiaria anomala UBC 951]KDN48897.1 hypothetical protein K437DRAFT_81984 [Tilletiaria anomala UBC 951]
MSSRMTVEQLRGALNKLGFSTKGHREDLRKRLKRAQKDIAILEQNFGKESVEQTSFEPQVVGTDDGDGGQTGGGPTSQSTAANNTQVQQEQQPFTPKITTFLVCDIEATCEITPWLELAPGAAGERGETIELKQPSSRSQAKKVNRDYPNEIIEFPVVVLRWDADAQEYKQGDVFHSYVKPIWRPRLSKFCRDLTGITQQQIDISPTWPIVEGKLYRFLRAQGVLENPWSWYDFEDGSEDERTCSDTDIESWDRSRFRLRAGAAWVTHGLADLHNFAAKQSWISGAHPSAMFAARDPRSKDAKGACRPPMWLRGPLLEIRKSIALLECLGLNSNQSTSNRDLTIDGLLNQLGLGTFEGRHHSGIDDAKNIARLVIEVGKRVRDCKVGVEKATNDVEGKVRPNRRGKSATIGSEAADATIPVDGLLKANDGTHSSPSQGAAAGLRAASAKVKGVPHKRRNVGRNEVEYNCLLPNTDYSAVGDQKWHWMGRKKGQIIWKHPMDPTMFVH